MCVTWQALISALAARVARDGHLVTQGELASLLAAGVPVDELARAFAGDSAACAHARAVLSRLARGAQD